MDELDIEEFAKRDPLVEQLGRDLARSKRAIADLKASQRALREELDLSDERLGFRDDISGFDPVKIEPRKIKTKNESCPILCLSDTHIGELVDPLTVNGRNKYTPEIAQSSIEAFFKNSLRMIENSRQYAEVNEAVLWLGGDIITGYIHEELQENNPLSPTEEVLLGQELIAGGIDFLMNHAKLDRLVVPCNYGNHGRTTQKRRISTGAKNSFEWLMYRNLEQHYLSSDQIVFDVANGSHLYVDVLGTMVRFHHGDDVRYHGGVGGLSIPLRKAVDAWDDFKCADITVIGHYHQRVDYGFAVVNGSTKGYDPYALSVKARFEEPQQSFLLIDRDRGKTISSPIFVRPR